jgi:hypothetical protein
VQHAVERIALACIRDRNPLAVVPDQRAGVARLAAAQRIEDRAIELDSSLTDRNDLGRKFYYVEEDLGVDSDTSIFLHTENFVLIDKNRHIRGIYNSLDPNSMISLKNDIMTLKKED